MIMNGPTGGTEVEAKMHYFNTVCENIREAKAKLKVP
jgi:hypothetical protein